MGVSATSGAAAARACQAACVVRSASSPRRRTPARGQQARELGGEWLGGEDQVPVRRLGGRLLDVAVVGQDPRVVGGDEQRAGVSRRRLVAAADDEPRQVAACRPLLDEDGVELERAQELADGGQTGRSFSRQPVRVRDRSGAFRRRLGDVGLVLGQGHGEPVRAVADAVRAGGDEEEVARLHVRERHGLDRGDPR